MRIVGFFIQRFFFFCVQYPKMCIKMGGWKLAIGLHVTKRDHRILH